MESLLESLERSSLNENKAARARATVNPVWGHEELKLTSWKFNEWVYAKQDADLPIRARGLFTVGDEIVLRGYDKFFNINELPSTKWPALKTETKGPYYASVKENGCLILIAGYGGKLIVTSKHSSGPRDNDGEANQKNHSLEGRRWVLRHLESVGKTEADLASELETLGVTAVGELCDDNFEEHVLAYSEKEAGIYITGLNKNTREFATLSLPEIQSLAKKYGFPTIDFLEYDSIDGLRTFLEDCAKTGSWNGREIEGFVVRCQRLADASDYFFKFKFDEPYLMYRQWREVTKSLIRSPEKVPNFGRHRASCLQYVRFAAPYLREHPELADSIITKGKGIIEMRAKFLESTDLSEQELVALSDGGETKYVLVPVATLGCGKTTVAVALGEMTGWAHVQNDDLVGKSKKALLTAKIMKGLAASDVIFVDRNNHQKREREQLFTDLQEPAAVQGYNLKFICLNFLPNGIDSKTWDETLRRVQVRKDNHQTIRDMKPEMVKSIMKGFVGRFQQVNLTSEPDSAFDSVIDLDPLTGSEYNTEKVLRVMQEKYGQGNDIKMPLKQAMAIALKHKATIPAALVNRNEPKKKPKSSVVYFGIKFANEPIQELVEKQLSQVPFYQKLATADGTLKTEFHVTLAFKTDKEQHRGYLKRFAKEIAESGSEKGFISLGPKLKVEVTDLCWNSKAIAAKVSLLDKDFPCANKYPHITLGFTKGTQAKEASTIFKKCETIHLSEPLVLEGSFFGFK